MTELITANSIDWILSWLAIGDQSVQRIHDPENYWIINVAHDLHHGNANYHVPLGYEEISLENLLYLNGLIRRLKHSNTAHMDFGQRYSKVIVHCAGGMERSPLVVATYLIQEGYASDYDDAYHFIKEIRPVVSDCRDWIDIQGSSSGRILDSESRDGDSNPSP